MISFIVIGRNESKKLKCTFDAVFNYIKQNQLIQYEIVYVDSNSSDNSIEIVSRYHAVKIFKILGQTNAALARQIGALESDGDFLFFIDGDMEIQSSFHSKIIDSDNNIKYDLVSGQIINLFYDNNFIEVIDEKPYYENLIKDRYELTFGGLFIIKKSIWNLFKGMRTEFKFGEDLDLSLRLSKRGVRLVRKKEVLAYHHTHNKDDYLISSLFKLGAFYSRGLLYRKNFFNPKVIIKIIKSDPTALLLFIILILSIITKNYYLIIFYLIVVFFIACIINKKSKKIVARFMYQLLRDLQVIFSFLFFYPKKIKMNYIKIN